MYTINKSAHTKKVWKLIICTSYFVVWSKFNLLHSFMWITFPVRWCLILYSFCACLLLLFIMCLNVSFLFPHKLYMKFFCVNWTLCHCFFVVIRRYSDSFLRFSFLRHIQLFLCAISSVCRLKYLYSCSSSRLCFIIYSLEFFTSALADGLSLEFEWQHVSSSLQDSSQYSGLSQCISLDGLHSSANTQVLQSLL